MQLQAKVILEELPATKQGKQLLDTRTYNTFIDAYITLASHRRTMHRENWVENAWLLYDAMERNSACGAPPTLHTYTLILQMWFPFGPDSKDPVMLLGSVVQDPVVLFLSIVQCEISPALMISHLSHIGDDLSRGLLVFDKAKPLSERTLQWLKNHLANLWGLDKACFDKRVQFMHDHLEDIYDSVPLAVPSDVHQHAERTDVAGTRGV